MFQLSHVVMLQDGLMQLSHWNFALQHASATLQHHSAHFHILHKAQQRTAQQPVIQLACSACDAFAAEHTAYNISG